MYTVEKISNWDIRVDIQTNKPCQLYVDTFPSSPKQCLRVLWSVEPNEIAGLRDIVINRHKEFDLILTWHKEVLDNCSNARLFPHGMSWILDFDLTKEKEYCVTSIVGGKKLTLNHIVRQELPTVINQVTSVPLHLFNSKNNPYNGKPTIDRFIQNSDIKNELFYSHKT